MLKSSKGRVALAKSTAATAQSGTPYFCFKDLDENKPTGSIRIRVEKIDYFLRRYREEVIRKRKVNQDIEVQLAALEVQLRSEGQEIPAELMTSDSWRNSAEAVAGDLIARAQPSKT